MRITHSPMPKICAAFASLLVLSVVLQEPDNGEAVHKIITEHQKQIRAQEQASKEREETYITTMPGTVAEDTTIVSTMAATSKVSALRRLANGPRRK